MRADDEREAQEKLNQVVRLLRDALKEDTCVVCVCHGLVVQRPMLRVLGLSTLSSTLDYIIATTSASAV